MKRLLRGLVVAAVLAFPGVAVAQCGPDEVFIGEDAIAWYCMKKSDYEGSRTQKLQEVYCQAEVKAKSERAAIKQLGLDADTDRFEMFAKLGEDQKKKITHAALSLVIDASLASASAAADSAKSLNPYNVNRAVAALERRGVAYEPFVKSLRAVAAQKDKPEKARKFKEFVEIVEKAKLGREEKAKAKEEPDDGFWHGLIAGIGIAGDTRLVAATVSVGDTIESLSYLWYASGQEEELRKSNDAKLAQLATLTKRLRDDVDSMKNAKFEWQIETGHPGAWPVCPAF